MNMKKPLAAIITASILAAGMVLAQQPVGNPSNWLGMAELEQRGISEGITVTEIEAKQRLAEVEGYDAQSRKVKLVIDRQTGEVLTRRVKEPKWRR